MPPIDLDSVDTVLATARSVRRKLDFERPVERQVILDCIDIATQAPTGLGGESWRFLVVTDGARKQALADLYGAVLDDLARSRGLEVKPTQRALVERLHEIPAMILVCTTAAVPGEGVAGQVAYYGSILPAAWSLMLALRARGLGATWTSLLSSRQQEVARILDMPAAAVNTVMLPVAYTKGATLKRADRRPAPEVTFWDAWGRQEG
ncbi:MAG: nitroreductase family protein [Pseudomonadales bacterium]